MAVLLVPTDLVETANQWPTLGPQVRAFIESYLVFGPGDLIGQPAVIDAEKAALIDAIYQVFPQDHEAAGRRRFKQEVVELAKGLAKTEFACWLVAAELHPDGPVRCDGFDAHGQPVGRGIIDPYIPMFSTTVDQTEELAYGALLKILERSALADDFDIGLDRIIRADGTGKAEALANSPGSADGRRTTCMHVDEPHQMTGARQIQTHTTSIANLPKRVAADAHAIYTSTRHDPSKHSVHRDLYETAEEIRAGKSEDPTLFFFSRHASRSHDIDTDEGLQAALEEASGVAGSWRDFRTVRSMFRKPRADVAYLCRTYLGWSMKGGGRVFDPDQLKSLTLAKAKAPKRRRGHPVALGFDGSRTRDATGIVLTDVLTGYQWVHDVWERDASSGSDWEVDRAEVDASMHEAQTFYNVIAADADPEYWDETISTWAGKYNRRGSSAAAKRLRVYDTRNYRKTGLDLRAYLRAMDNREVSLADDPRLLRHMVNAWKKETKYRVVGDDPDEEVEEFLFVMSKERDDSPEVIDLAMCALLSHTAWIRALATGAATRRRVVAGGGHTYRP